MLQLHTHVHVCKYDMHVCSTRSSTSCTGPTHSNKQCTPVCVTLFSSVVPLQFQQTLISYSSLFLWCTDVKSIFLESARQYYLGTFYVGTRSLKFFRFLNTFSGLIVGTTGIKKLTREERFIICTVYLIFCSRWFR